MAEVGGDTGGVRGVAPAHSPLISPISFNMILFGSSDNSSARLNWSGITWAPLSSRRTGLI